ncbi:hypothetical protein [Litchfieldia alkalitelluris]|uniref:hypothetical protein n=1 Tax=Litchfieldia alkalitelluris TaxID=304268 RepID=UPI0009982B76|nr:hypothetical protein [Litchfieldia alkalitelluris]
MKRWILVCSMLLLFMTILGCSSNQSKGAEYYVLVVEGEKNISEEFGKFAGNEYPVVEVEYLTSLDSVNKKYPRYEIKKAPAILIFETNGELKKLQLKTYDVAEATDFLSETK